MSKLKLNLNDLEVTSFDTDRATAGRGTVAGHLNVESGPTCGPFTCMPGDHSCYENSCAYTDV